MNGKVAKARREAEKAVEKGNVGVARALMVVMDYVRSIEARVEALEQKGGAPVGE